MAAVQKVVTVDLGTSTLKVGEFGLTRGGGLTLLRFGVAELGLDPNKEEDRGPLVTAALAKLFKDLGVRGREVTLSISGQSVFMRFVKLPPVAPEQIEQVVAFEAQQNVPFPINEVTWDYQMMPNRSAGSEAEAVIVAIKKDVLEGEVIAVENAGVRIKRVDVAPFGPAQRLSLQRAAERGVRAHHRHGRPLHQSRLRREIEFLDPQRPHRRNPDFAEHRHRAGRTVRRR